MATVTEARPVAEINLDRIRDLPFAVRFRPPQCMTDDQLFEFCAINQFWQIERTKSGEIVIMPPCGGEGSDRNCELSMQLRIWAKKDKTGKAFDATCGFTRPDGSMRAPDAAWISLSRWKALTAKQRKKFLPLCPEFLVELRSETDRLTELQRKMVEWMKNGAKLAWLIDPQNRQVHVYRAGKRMQTLNSPDKISADPVLPGFELDLREIWEDMS